METDIFLYHFFSMLLNIYNLVFRFAGVYALSLTLTLHLALSPNPKTPNPNPKPKTLTLPLPIRYIKAAVPRGFESVSDS